MDQMMLETYSDYLIFSFGQTSVTVLSRLLDNTKLDFGHSGLRAWLEALKVRCSLNQELPSARRSVG